MSQPPLTHHDILRIVSPLRNRGYVVDLARCHREKQYIEFENCSSFSDSIRCAYSVQLTANSNYLVTRTLIHDSGLMSTVSTRSSDLLLAFNTIENFSHEHQVIVSNEGIIARSYFIKSRPGGGSGIDLELQYCTISTCGVEARIDASTGGSMPADVRLFSQGVNLHFLPETLANGKPLPATHLSCQNWFRDNPPFKPSSTDTRRSSNASHHTNVKKMPDDLLAVLGKQWRPLRYQGDHWKGVLRALGKGNKRTQQVENHVSEALSHLHQTFSQPPSDYHSRHQQARWQAYIRRLQPLMLFIAILGLIPLSWFLVSSGNVGIHPLVLGLTPLLMVGVVVLTAREIPVMEIPPKPSEIPRNYWSTTT